MDDVKFGEILLPGDEATQAAREKTVREKFWGVLQKSARRIPFARDAVAAYYCATDPATPRRVKAILLGALAYFIMPVDMVPDVFALVGFTDDLAVLSAAIAMVRGHLNANHYLLADQALSDEGEDRKI